MPSRLGEPRKRSGAARFAGPVAGTPAISDAADEEVAALAESSNAESSNIVEIAPLPAVTMASLHADELPSSRHAAYIPAELPSSRLAVKTAKPEKRAVAIRLTAEALRRLMEIETSLRGSGFSAHQASASEIVMALLEAADTGDLRDRLGRRFKVRSK